MKTVLKRFFTIFMFFCAVSVFADNITANRLPQKIQDFLIANFPDASVNYVKQGFLSYQIALSNGVTGIFSQSGEYTKIDGGGSVLPFTILNPAMAAVIQSKFPNAGILSAKQVWKGWQITLDNNIQVLVSSIGQLLGYSSIETPR